MCYNRSLAYNVMNLWYSSFLAINLPNIWGLLSENYWACWFKIPFLNWFHSYYVYTYVIQYYNAKTDILFKQPLSFSFKQWLEIICNLVSSLRVLAGTYIMFLFWSFGWNSYTLNTSKNVPCSTIVCSQPVIKLI